MPETTTGWAAGIAVGQAYAAELDAFIQETSDPSAFGAVIRAITMKGVYEAVETGFTAYFGLILAGANT